MKQPHQTIQKLLLTEKGTVLTEKQNQYIFRVHPDANKLDVKKAVESLFKVKVVKVNTMNRPGKLKRERSMFYGRTSEWKRAIVTLKQGDSIQLN